MSSLSQVGKDTELDAVGRQFELEPYPGLTASCVSSWMPRLAAAALVVPVWPGIMMMLFSNSRGY